MKPGRAEILLLAGSLFAVLLLVGAGELAVRAFSSVGLLGNSKNLFVANAYGTSNGNAHDAVASSFGLPVYTDEHGFRVPEGGVAGDAHKAKAILLLGDSVGFGPGVEEPETIAGRLRARFRDWRIYNSSVIGYSTPDYRNVVERFVPAHPEVAAVALVYCLNDVSASSARNIDRYLNPQRPAPPADLTETLRSFRVLSDANDYLRSHSKLYLWIRHRVLQTQTRDWRYIAQQYADDTGDGIERAAHDIAAIAALLEAGGIPFIVVLSPFEYQLRNPADPEVDVPQQKVGDLLAQAGVAFVDPRPSFDPNRRSTDYFLAYDSMHFSAEGHRVIADVIADRLAR